MMISLVGDMIEVTPEHAEAIEYITGDPPTRNVLIKYIQEAYQRTVYLDCAEYRSEVRIAKAARLRTEAAELTKQADALDGPKIEVGEDQ